MVGDGTEGRRPGLEAELLRMVERGADARVEPSGDAPRATLDRGVERSDVAERLAAEQPAYPEASLVVHRVAHPQDGAAPWTEPRGAPAPDGGPTDHRSARQGEASAIAGRADDVARAAVPQGGALLGVQADHDSYQPDASVAGGARSERRHMAQESRTAAAPAEARDHGARVDQRQVASFDTDGPRGLVGTGADGDVRPGGGFEARATGSVERSANTAYADAPALVYGAESTPGRGAQRVEALMRARGETYADAPALVHESESAAGPGGDAGETRAHGAEAAADKADSPRQVGADSHGVSGRGGDAGQRHTHGAQAAGWKAAGHGGASLGGRQHDVVGHASRVEAGEARPGIGRRTAQAAAGDGGAWQHTPEMVWVRAIGPLRDEARGPRWAAAAELAGTAARRGGGAGDTDGIHQAFRKLLPGGGASASGGNGAAGQGAPVQRAVEAGGSWSSANSGGHSSGENGATGTSVQGQRAVEAGGSWSSANSGGHASGTNGPTGTSVQVQRFTGAAPSVSGSRAMRRAIGDARARSRAADGGRTEQTQVAPEIDYQALAQQVYRRIKQRLLVERERAGLSRVRA
jgi:hypothetical protein